MTIILLIVLFRNLKDLFAGFQAMHNGHLDVHKDELVGPVLTFAWGLEG